MGRNHGKNWIARTKSTSWKWCKILHMPKREKRKNLPTQEADVSWQSGANIQYSWVIICFWADWGRILKQKLEEPVACYVVASAGGWNQTEYLGSNMSSQIFRHSILWDNTSEISARQNDLCETLRKLMATCREIHGYTFPAWVPINPRDLLEWVPLSTGSSPC